jgi:hypothetical protein
LIEGLISLQITTPIARGFPRAKRRPFPSLRILSDLSADHGYDGSLQGQRVTAV